MITREIAALAASLRIQPIDLVELHASQPAFDAIAYAEAARRGCVAVRDAAGLLSIVLGNAYDLDTQDWIEDRMRADFRYRLAQSEDVAAYLAKQESALRALDGFSSETTRNVKDDAEEISFESASEGDSTVVRLVSSTLYDALKAGASDVHLESTASGPDHPLPRRRRAHRGAGHARQRARRAGDLARQGDVGARHRRAARAAGRALQGASRRPRHRLPRLGDAERVRRGRGAAHSRPAHAVRPDERADAGRSRL
jgi:hypothetical protein